MFASIINAASINLNKIILPSSDNVSFTGRTETLKDGSVRYDWTGVYMQTCFTGGAISIIVSDTGKSYYNIFIDGRLIKKILITGIEPHNIILAKNLSRDKHILYLQKCTEGQYGCTTIHKICIAKSAYLTSVPRKNRKIEVIGDSYTCGFGVESKCASDTFRLDTENSNFAYGCLIARYFDADYILTAHSGQGMVRDWADSSQVSKENMSSRYPMIYDNFYDNRNYNFKSYIPQLVIINLGTNDFSPTAIPTDAQYEGAYIKMIKMIKSKYGNDVKILCVIPHSASLYLSACLSDLSNYISSMEGVYIANAMPGIVTEKSDMGASWHPNISGQQKIAMTLIPKISAIMGWPMEQKIVE